MHQVHGPSSGLYAITPADWPAQKLLAAVDEALTAGLRRLQYRAKPQPDESVARQLLARCRRAGAQLIINDDVVLARSEERRVGKERESGMAPDVVKETVP